MAQLGDEGKAEVVKLLRSADAAHRLTAFRALKAIGEDKNYWVQMSNDADAAVRREVGIALRDIPFETSRESILQLVKKFDGKDPWMLEAIGTAADGKEDKVYGLVKEIYRSEPLNWTPQRAGLTWRLHPAEAINDLKIRASSKQIPEAERRRTLTAIGFIKDKKAAEAMVSLSKSPLPDVSSQASWWLNFRKTNDWADLLNWEEATATVMTPAYRKMLELKKTVTDKNNPLNQRIEAAKTMASDKDGGNILVDMRVQGQLQDTIAKSVSEIIFKNPDQQVRVVGEPVFS